MTFIQIKEIRMSQKIKSNITLGHNLRKLRKERKIIDTPGFASFDTQELDLELKEHLPETFPEFAPYVGGCRFVGCSHTKEKGCAVLEAVHQGKIPRSRHASYLRLYNELKDLKAWDKK